MNKMTKTFYFDELVMNNILCYIPQPKKFKEGINIYSDECLKVFIPKRSKCFVWFEIKINDIIEVSIKKKIYKDTKNNEYIKVEYYSTAKDEYLLYVKNPMILRIGYDTPKPSKN